MLVLDREQEFYTLSLSEFLPKIPYPQDLAANLFNFVPILSASSDLFNYPFCCCSFVLRCVSCLDFCVFACFVFEAESLDQASLKFNM